MRRVGAISFTLLFAGFGLAQDKETTWTSHRWGFAVTLPANWEFEELKEPQAGIVAKFGGEGGAVAGLISREKADGTPEEYLDACIKKVKETHPVRIEGRWIRPDHAQLTYASQVDGKDYKYLVRAIDASGTKIRIAVWSLEADFEKFSERFDKFAKTLQTAPILELKTHRSERWGFEVTLLAAWKFEEFAEAQDHAVARFEGEDGALSGFVIAEEKTGTVDAYFDAKFDTFRKQAKLTIHNRDSGKTEGRANYTLTTEDKEARFTVRFVDVAGVKLGFVAWTAPTLFDGVREKLSVCADSLKASATKRPVLAMKTHVSEMHGVSVALPAEYQFEELKEPQLGTLATFHGTTEDIGGLIAEEVWKGTPEKYLDAVLANIGKQLEIKVVNHTATAEAAEATYTATIDKRSFTYYARVTEVSDRKLRFCGWAPSDTFDGLKETFMRCALTLKLVRGRATTSDRWGYSLSLPADWKYEELDKPEGSTVARFSGKIEGHETAGLMIVDRVDGTPEAYLDRVLDSVKERSTKVLDRTATKEEATIAYTSKVEEQEITYIQRVIVVGETKFRVAVWCLAENFEAEKAAMSEVARSLGKK